MKAPRKVPKWFWKIPPQVPWPQMTEPLVLTFSQGEEVTFHITKMISLTCRLWGGTTKESRIPESETMHLPIEALPLIDTKEWMHTLVAWIGAKFEENHNVLQEIRIECNVCTTAAINKSETSEEHLRGISENQGPSHNWACVQANSKARPQKDNEETIDQKSHRTANKMSKLK